MFEIIPSIDLRAGRVVDLLQGDYDRETVYETPAEAVAEQFVAAGARWIHVVDLDGAKAGTPVNRDLIRRLAMVAARGGARIEVGGGIRSLEAARAALDDGAARVIFGTAAAERPEVVTAAVTTFGPEAVIAGIDARDGRVAIRGWTASTSLSTIDLARRMVEAGVRRLIYTDVSRDSTLTEPNFDALERLSRAVAASVIASGGVTTAGQVRRLAALGLEGAIIGSAFYTGRLTLAAALAAARGSGAEESERAQERG